MERERVQVESRTQWRAWLEQYHATSPGIWLVTYRRSAGERHLTYEQIVCEALCFGWVDSQTKGVDDDRTSIMMTPRRAGSPWSRSNRDRVDQLTDAGLMHAAGLAAVASAQADGSWLALVEVEQLVEPADLATALDGDPTARRGWDRLSRSRRFAALLRLHGAKRPATRAAHVATIVQQARDAAYTP